MKIITSKLARFISISVLLFSLLLPSLFFVPSVSAGDITAGDLWGGDDFSQQDFYDETGLGNADPRAIAASVIKVLLGFLGIIAVLIVLYAGFLWMTAAGNDDKISKAKSMMTAGVIGMVIVLAAFGIATFVMNALVTATTA
ncbi:hypothetical protein C0584_06200 [Candidatus Parcubacteria bacterium]|nr:MAG: hypothetical protein C0584_06200 [Candidatus Parcubacteria bacterium]